MTPLSVDRNSKYELVSHIYHLQNHPLIHCCKKKLNKNIDAVFFVLFFSKQ